MGAAERLPELLTEDEAASYLGVSVPTLRRWREAGAIGFFRVGKKPKYTVQDLQTYLDKNRCPPKDLKSADTGLSAAKGRRTGRGLGGTKERSSVLALAHRILNAPSES